MRSFSFLGAALCALGLVALSAALWQRRRTEAILNRCRAMVERAMNGGAQDLSFDEELPSALEAQLADYLRVDALTADRLAQEQARIKTLISDISHQTKTPISNISLYAELLAEAPLDQQSHACAAALLEQTDKLRFLIDALVKLSRLEAGIFVMQPKVQPVAALLAQAAAQMGPQAEKKNLTLQVEPTAAIAQFDGHWTAEALFNLVDNAVKYTPAGGRVCLRATCFELFCRIDVADTGSGIPEAEQSRVFARFYRGALAQETEGVGLGLYLAREIVLAQGGYLQVRSKPGQGACFSLYLPRAEKSGG